MMGKHTAYCKKQSHLADKNAYWKLLPCLKTVHLGLFAKAFLIQLHEIGRLGKAH